MHPPSSLTFMLLHYAQRDCYYALAFSKQLFSNCWLFDMLELIPDRTSKKSFNNLVIKRNVKMIAVQKFNDRIWLKMKMDQCAHAGDITLNTIDSMMYMNPL